ncbi:hypothetical protein [Actinomycetospora sp. TBRC 11914]|uniref:hypothetical protein n=1 Tax=Actinomycetospora sp. TBRC 11914 TaxID=2729387 RepID=UPI00145DAB5D|nr:hypothetical protein [Actinomycetospora sp. TBRC 11914]NMO92709.1 hypothetical protein [Actinomycetospora sp. TBRC 11914]
MITIVDPELDVRLGSLAADETDRIQRYATAAFLWRGFSQDEALDVARGLHWRAVGLDPAAPAGEVLGALALEPLDEPLREHLAILLDLHDRADPGGPGPDDGAPGPRDHGRLGRRITTALALLRLQEHSSA